MKRPAGGTPAATSKPKLVAVLVASLLVVGGMWAAIVALGLQPRFGLDLQGGVSITMTPTPGQGEIDPEIFEQTVTVIRQRVDAIGVAEPDVARQGETVLIQLPGFTDTDEALEIVGRTAQLQFRRVLEVIPPGDPQYETTGPACGEPLPGGIPPHDEEVVLCEPELDDRREELPPQMWTKYRLGPLEIDGSGVRDANARLDQAGFNWEVGLQLDSEGAEQFARITAELACEPLGAPQRQLAIVLDDRVESAPQMGEGVQCGIGIPGGEAIITVGQGGQDDARQLALVIRSGALPISLDFATAQSVSPTLGETSLRAGLQAGLMGLLLVALYLIALYRGIGIAAVIELLMFGAIVFGMIIVLGELIGFTLTLAGIAGIIVSIGIAADSSIIYRERYRDEIKAGRTVRTAADHAFRRAWRTNLTGNTVSFLAALVLYALAIGPVRGFAFTLGLSTLIDTALFGTFTRSLFGLIARNPKLARSPLVGLSPDVVSPTLVEEPEPEPQEREPSTEQVHQ